MLSGDGLIVRVRPRLARLTAAQIRVLRSIPGLANAEFLRYGSIHRNSYLNSPDSLGTGLIDLTNRANLQLRGINLAETEPLLLRLAAADLLDVDAEAEGRRNVLCAPDWEDGDDTHSLTLELNRRLAELPLLPAKFSFVIDAGQTLALATEPADLRIERGRSGGLILRAGRSARGAVVSAGDAVGALIALAGDGAGVE